MLKMHQNARVEFKFIITINQIFNVNGHFKNLVGVFQLVL